MIIRKKEFDKLLEDIRSLINGEDIDIRENKEGSFYILKNDIHILAEKFKSYSEYNKNEKTLMANTLVDISHQIKTPLSAISLMLELLLYEGEEEKKHEFLKNIETLVNEMIWFSDILLKVSKLDAKTIIFNKIDVKSSSLIENALKPLEILLELRGQEVKISGELSINCDFKWTSEALTNVIKNALEHSPKNSTIYIECNSNILYKEISITDEGDGIPKERLHDVFKRFNSKSKGYGIGLSLAYSIMEAQKGKLSVYSNGEKGTTFFFRFY